MEKTISLFLAILTLGFAQQIFAQDENASADDSERWSDFLPLNKEMAGDADLPLPFGIGVTGYWQKQDMKTKSDIEFEMVTTAFGGLLPDPLAATAGATNVESEVDNFNVRVDGWLLPFLNVYGVYGEVDGENTVSGLDVDSDTVNLLAAIPVLAGGPILIPDTPFTFPYDGNVYGFGLILAGQWGKYWGTLDYNYMRADLSISTSKIDTRTITPRIGTSGTIGSTKGSLWIGAMHQDSDERQTGTTPFTVTVAGLPTDVIASYDANFEQENEWNFLIGGSAELSEQFHVSVEGGFGDRKQVMGNLTFRF
jgi:hypothetical protein